jgi:hypothetical protein
MLIRATTEMVDDGRAIDALREAFAARDRELPPLAPLE